MSHVTVQEKKQKQIHATGTQVVQQVNVNQNVAPQQRMKIEEAEDLLKSPLERNAVMVSGVNLTLPTEEDLVHAYESTEFELTDSVAKRKTRLDESKRRFSLQETLINKEKDPLRRNNAPVPKRISMKDAIKMGDRELVEKLDRITTGNGYLDTRYALLKNKYYALVPEREIRKLSRGQLLERLRKLYAVKPDERDKDLILYYQSVIALMDYEKSEKEKDENPDPGVPYLQRPSLAELKKENGGCLKRNEKAIDSLCLSDEETKKRKDVMNSILVPANDKKVWRADKKDQISGSQKEGIRQVLAWMYRNCSKYSDSKEPFVYKLTQAEPEKLLLMFYLIENNKEASPSAADIANVTLDYVPDLKTFKSRVVASKAKFWKRIGSDSSDSVIDWSKLGNVARFVLNSEIADDYCKLTRKKTEAAEKLSKPENSGDDKQREILLESISAQGNLLINLYRSAGLSPDMPLGLVEDKKLRQKIITALGDFQAASEKLLDILKRTGPGEGEDLKAATHYNRDRDFEELPEEDEDSGEFVENVETAGNVLGTVAEYDNIVSLFGETLEDISDTTFYGAATGGLASVVSILGLVSSLGNAAILAKGASALSAADHTAQALSVAGDVIGSVADLTQGVADVVGNFVNLGSAGDVAGVVEDTVVRTASEAFSTVSGSIQFCTGCVTILAGGLQTGSAAIQYARAKSSEHDVERSEKKLKELERKGELTEHQKILSDFLKHEKNVISDQKASAAINAVSGTLKMIGGALTVSGILGPLGAAIGLVSAALDIGLGIFYMRKRKNDTMLSAVDQALNVEDEMKRLKNSSDRAKNMDEKDLRKAARQNLLGQMGYATPKEMFSDVNKKTALVLFEHVFGKDADKQPDYQMYLDALKSLGTKIKIPRNAGDKSFPTADVIYSKLME